MTEGAELMEVHIEQRLHTTLYMVEDEVAEEQKLDSIWWNQWTSGLYGWKLVKHMMEASL